MKLDDFLFILRMAGTAGALVGVLALIWLEILILAEVLG